MIISVLQSHLKSAIRHCPAFLVIVENADDSDAATLGFPDEVHNRGTILVVKRGCWLVQEHDGIARRKTPGDVDALLFAPENVVGAIFHSRMLKNYSRFHSRSC